MRRVKVQMSTMTRLGSLGTLASGGMAALLWSTAAPILALIDKSIPIINVIALQYIFAAIGVVAYNLVTLFYRRTTFTYRPQHLSFSYIFRHKTPIVLIIIFSALNITHELVYFFGIRSQCPFEANIVNYLWPVWLYLLSLVIDNKSKLFTLAGVVPLLCAFFAIAMMLSTSEGRSCDFIPLLSGIISSLSAAGYMIMFIKLEKDFDISILTLLSISTPFLAIIFSFIGIHTIKIIYSIHYVYFDLLMIVYLSIFTVLIPELLWAYGLKRFGGAALSKWAYTIPVLSTLWLSLVRRELPSFDVVFSAAFVLMAVWLAYRSSKKPGGQPGSDDMARQ
jgi:drug/metabolite transporter (DMT)-like permease